MKFKTLSLAQDRCLHELRRGRPVALIDANPDQAGPDHVTLVWCVDQAHTIPFDQLEKYGQGQVLISGPRAGMLGLPADMCILPIGGQPPAALQADLDFLVHARTHTTLMPRPAPAYAAALIDLGKAGRLIPAFYLVQVPRSAIGPETFTIQIDDLTHDGAPADLERISTVHLPIELDHQTIDTRALLFRGGPLNEEFVALQLGDVQGVQAPLVRLHSACLTGDVFGSLRCDCGPQLHQALHTMEKDQAGCLLYLPQEGRDTGLSNKLRAYALQESGLDTIDADATLGFEEDERDFAFAAAMLRLMGLETIRLLTNNPKKVEGLEDHGIKVRQRVPLIIPAHDHNAHYLHTKATRAGHQL